MQSSIMKKLPIPAFVTMHLVVWTVTAMSFLVLVISLLWSQRDMKIHVFDVGQGSSQLIVFPSSYTVLIDIPSGQDPATSTPYSKLVAARIREITGGSHVDVAVATHLHNDHIGGFRDLIETEGINFDKLIDRDHSSWNDTNADGRCTKDELTWHNAGELSDAAVDWACYVLNPANTNVHAIRELAVLGSTSQIDPPDYGGNVLIMSADGIGVGDESSITGDHTADQPAPPAENDYGVSVAVLFWQFTYLTTADVGGVYSVRPNNKTFNDVEQVISHRLAGEVDMFSAGHHGSDFSNSAAFLAAIKPQVSLVSCGKDNTFGHPGQAALDRLLNVGDVYLTERGTTATDYKSAVIANSEIVVTIAEPDGSWFTVSTLNGQNPHDYTSKNSDLLWRVVLQ